MFEMTPSDDGGGMTRQDRDTNPEADAIRPAIRIFTMGSSGKTAEEFFTLLKDNGVQAPIRSVQMTRAAAEITRNARGQRRRSVPDRKNAPSGASEWGLDAVRRAPQGLGRPGIRLVKARWRDTIMETADDGRQ